MEFLDFCIIGPFFLLSYFYFYCSFIPQKLLRDATQQTQGLSRGAYQARQEPT